MTEDRQAGGAAWWWSIKIDPSAKFGFRWALREEDPGRAARIVRKHRTGYSLPDDEIPRELSVDPKTEKEGPNRLPHAFMGSGFYIVSSRFVSALKEFDLGRAQISQITLLKLDRQTEYEGDWFLLNIANTKECFEPSVSTGFELPLYEDDTHLGTVGHTTKDNQVFLNHTALSGADIWFEPRLSFPIFFSDRLAERLRQDRLLGRTKLVRCQVVTVH